MFAVQSRSCQGKVVIISYGHVFETNHHRILRSVTKASHHAGDAREKGSCAALHSQLLHYLLKGSLQEMLSQHSNMVLIVELRVQFHRALLGIQAKHLHASNSPLFQT